MPTSRVQVSAPLLPDGRFWATAVARWPLARPPLVDTLTLLCADAKNAAIHLERPADIIVCARARMRCEKGHAYEQAYISRCEKVVL